MPYIRLSTDIVNLPSKITIQTIADQTVAPSAIYDACSFRFNFPPTSHNSPGVIIFKGTPPTDFKTSGTYDASTALFDSGVRVSDRLIRIPYDRADMVSNNASFVINLNASNNATAEASGTASWFILDGSVNSDNGSQRTLKVMGTISAPGGGGELIIGSTTITSGVSYSFGPMQITFPRSFTT